VVEHVLEGFCAEGEETVMRLGGRISWNVVWIDLLGDDADESDANAFGLE